MKNNSARNTLNLRHRAVIDIILLTLSINITRWYFMTRLIKQRYTEYGTCRKAELRRRLFSPHLIQ